MLATKTCIPPCFQASVILKSGSNFISDSQDPHWTKSLPLAIGGQN